MIVRPSGVSSAQELILARDPHTHPDILAKLVLRPDCAAAVAGNPNTPATLLWSLACAYPNAVVHNPILPLLLLADPAQVDSLLPDEVEALTRFADCPPLIRRRLCDITPYAFRDIVNGWRDDALKNRSPFQHGAIDAYMLAWDAYCFPCVGRSPHDWVQRSLRQMARKLHPPKQGIPRTEYEQGYWNGIVRVQLFLMRLQEAIHDQGTD